MVLSEISIRRPVFAWMLMAALIIFGAISFRGMGVSQLPDVDFPVVTVNLNYPGTAPEVMEITVADPVEDAVMSVQGVRNVTSTSITGSATVTVEFELGRDIDAALQEVQTKVAQAQRLLPREMDAPVITKTNPEDQPILWLAVSSDALRPPELMAYVRDQMKNQFATVSGVGDIVLGGYLEPNLRVWVSANQLALYDLTVTDVLAAIQNEHLEPPSGYLQSNRKESNIRTLGEANTPEAFGDIAINARGGAPNFKPIRLKQVARVEEGLEDVRRISRVMGRSAVGLGIRKQRGSNAVAVADGVRARMKELEPQLPPGVRLDVNFDSTQFIQESVRELNFTLLLSAILTGVVCWLFLGSWSSTLNILLAIPTSIVGAFMILYFAGFTLNTFTLLGLSLAIGIVVDDAIMVLENIVRHREMGKTRMDAALAGSREITFAATAATIAIVAIFLPVAFMSGIIGKFFLQFGVTMTVAVLLSLLEALTLTPMRASQFVEVSKRRSAVGRWVDRSFERSRDLYRGLLAAALQHRWIVLLATLVFFIASFATLRFLPKEFVPPQDQGIFLVRLQTPVGSSIEYTDSRFRAAEAFFRSRPEVLRYFTAVGGLGGGEVNSGILFITMKPRGEREIGQQELMNLTRKSLNSIPDVKAFVQDLSLRGFTASRGFPVEFTIEGPDLDRLASAGGEIMKQLNQTGLVSDLDTDYQLGKPEVRITPDRTTASERAVPVASIAQTISAMLGGVVAGQYTKSGHRYDIRVRLEPGEQSRPDVLKLLKVRNNRGEIIPLSELVHVETRSALQSISRRDRQRSMTIFGNVKPGASQAAALSSAEQIARRALPPGYHLILSGSGETFQESFQSLLFALLLGVVVSYMILASQFNSYMDPMIVLMALPFSASGAFLSLWVGRQSLNIYSLIGLILLMGIVKKNSILLVDFTNQIRAHGEQEVDHALLEACPIRLRPILMTSIAIVAAAIPPALAVGPGAETRIPMALAIIGGVIFSTTLTLFAVPCAYSLVENRRWFRSKPPGNKPGEPEKDAA